MERNAESRTQSLSPSALKPSKRVEGTHQIQRFFWAAAGLDVDKDDLRRYYNFVDQKVADLLLIAQHKTKANDRVKVELRDLPITKGLQESIHAFEALDMDIGLERILERNVPEPPFDLPYSIATKLTLDRRSLRRSEPCSRTHLQDHGSADQASCNPNSGSAHFKSSTCCCRTWRNLGQRWLTRLPDDESKQANIENHSDCLRVLRDG